MNLYDLFLHAGGRYGSVWHLRSDWDRGIAMCGRPIGSAPVFIHDAAGPVCRQCRTHARNQLERLDDLLAELDQPGGLP